MTTKQLDEFERLLEESFKSKLNVADVVRGLVLKKENDGYLIFQEDTIRFLQNICGLTGAEADNVRRAIGRKQLDRLQAALPKILEGYCKMSPQPREIAEQEAKQFLKIIEDSASYQFGYNHSTGYSMIGYLCGYLRYYYPVEFIASYLKNANNEADIKNGTALAKQMNVSILPIQFRHSSAYYVPDKENRSIYKGVASLKFFNAPVCQQLYDMRETVFPTFIDFLKVNPCDSRQTIALIKLNFFSEFGKSQKLLDTYRLFTLYDGKKQISKNKTKHPIEIIQKYSKETAKKYMVSDMEALIKEVSDTFENKSVDIKDLLDTQAEFLGYIDYTNPKAKGFIYVTNVDTKYSPKISAYRLDTGENVVYKLAKKDYSLNPFGEKSLLIVQTKSKPKMRKNGDEWVKSETESEEWITNYTVRG